jgi:hypothetical protein
VALWNPDPKKKTDDVRVEVGERLNLGTLVYVHPSGAVTEEPDGKRRFHPIGSVVKAGTVISEESNPLMYHELAKLEHRHQGISDEKKRNQ